MIVRIFAPSVLAKPLNNAQIVRGVFVYTHLNMANLMGQRIFPVGNTVC